MLAFQNFKEKIADYGTDLSVYSLDGKKLECQEINDACFFISEHFFLSLINQLS